LYSPRAQCTYSNQRVAESKTPGKLAASEDVDELR
jgi:hypothetical protein